MICSFAIKMMRRIVRAFLQIWINRALGSKLVRIVYWTWIDTRSADCLAQEWLTGLPIIVIMTIMIIKVKVMLESDVQCFIIMIEGKVSAARAARQVKWRQVSFKEDVNEVLAVCLLNKSIQWWARWRKKGFNAPKVGHILQYIWPPTVRATASSMQWIARWY